MKQKSMLKCIICGDEFGFIDGLCCPKCLREEFPGLDDYIVRVKQ